MITVVLDANVLYPMLLRDTLLRCAAAGLFQIRWSSKILEEMTSNLVRDYGMPAEAADALRQIMDEAFPEAMVDGWEELEPAMRNDSKDRHVAAAAAASGAVAIVTANTRDFYDLPAGIDAAHPDEFLCALFNATPSKVGDVLHRQASGYRRPTLTTAELLARLAVITPNFARIVLEHLNEEG